MEYCKIEDSLNLKSLCLYSEDVGNYSGTVQGTMPAKSLGTLTSISKVKTNHPPLPHGTVLVYYQTG